jgi:isochorismate synthase
LPADSARNYLLFHEAHQRSLYGGFLGPVDAQGHSQLYVNLRSMELHKGSASLYLGGGIVAGSVPAAEWQETEHKAATLLRILQH